MGQPVIELKNAYVRKLDTSKNYHHFCQHLLWQHQKTSPYL